MKTTPFIIGATIGAFYGFFERQDTFAERVKRAAIRAGYGLVIVALILAAYGILFMSRTENE